MHFPTQPWDNSQGGISGKKPYMLFIFGWYAPEYIHLQHLTRDTVLFDTTRISNNSIVEVCIEHVLWTNTNLQRCG